MRVLLGDNVSLLISHKVEDVSEVLIGLGLLVIWLVTSKLFLYVLWCFLLSNKAIALLTYAGFILMRIHRIC